MAAKKKKVSKKKTTAKKSTALAVKTTAMSTLTKEEIVARMMADAGKAVAKLPSGMPRISIQDKIFTVGDITVGTTMEVIIIAYCHEQRKYESSYNEDTIESPICYAIGDDEDELAPAENVQERLADTCFECPNFEWGSAENGKGRACSSRIRALVITGDCSAEQIRQGKLEVCLLSIPAKSLGNFKGHVKDVYKRLGNLPVYGVVTKVSFDPDESREVLLFEAASVVEDYDLLASIMDLQETEGKALYNGYTYESPKATLTAKGKKLTKKKVGKKKAAKGKKRFN